MLRSLESIHGFRISATDEEIGHVGDFLFDDRSWALRYLVVDTGTWISGRRVLVSPAVMGSPDWDGGRLPLQLTARQISDAPPLAEHAPISEFYESRLAIHYGYPLYTSMPAPWGSYPAPLPLAPDAEKPTTDLKPSENQKHLRSFTEVQGYRIDTGEKKIGRISDLVVDDDAWRIHSVVVDTGTWLRGRRVLLAPGWFDAIDWAESAFHTDLTPADIRGAPEFDPRAPINAEYELRLYDYYGRPYE